jgi:hypothetical protein
MFMGEIPGIELGELGAVGHATDHGIVVDREYSLWPMATFLVTIATLSLREGSRDGNVTGADWTVTWGELTAPPVWTANKATDTRCYLPISICLAAS